MGKIIFARKKSMRGLTPLIDHDPTGAESREPYLQEDEITPQQATMPLWMLEELFPLRIREVVTFRKRPLDDSSRPEPPAEFQQCPETSSSPEATPDTSEQQS